MHCMKCGAQLPQDAKFCYKCGTPVGQAKTEGVKEIQWEYCEIQREKKTNWLGRDKNWFYIDVVSPHKGKYQSLKSREFRRDSINHHHSTDKEVQQIFDEFVTQLTTKEGWEPLPARGQWWYQLRFRRRAE